MKKSMKRLLGLLLALALCGTAAMAQEADGLLDRAEAYCQAGDMQRALACVDLAARLAPQDARVDLTAAEICLAADDVPGALRYVESALEKDPLSPRGWILRCRCDLLGRDAEALEKDLLYAEICGVAPSALEAAAIGALFAQAQQNEQAIVWLERAGIDTLDEAQRSAYAQALTAVGRLQEAQTMVRSAARRRDDALAAAFRADALTAVEAAFDWSGCRVADPDELDLPGSIREDMTELLAHAVMELQEGKPLLLSCSPAGNTALVGIDDSVFALHDRVIRPIFPHEERGIAIADLKRPYTGMERHTVRKFGGDPVVWSHDGRYAVLTNYEEWAVRFRSVELLLLDTWRGDEIILESFPEDLLNEKSGTVANACFSPDDGALYYTIYGYVEDIESRIWLCRCDLDTLEITRLQGTGFDEAMSDTYFPGLYLLEDGSLIALSRPFRSPWGVVRMMPNGERRLYRFSDEGGGWNGRRLLYNENSGWAVVPVSADEGIRLGDKATLIGISALIAFRPETQEDREELRPMVLRCQAVDGAPRLFCEPMDMAALNGMSSAADVFAWSQSVVAITAVCLSPDGYYALAVVSRRAIDRALLDIGLTDEISDQMCYVLIDLETGEAKLMNQNPDQMNSFFPSMYPGLEWNGDWVIFHNRQTFTTVHVQ